MSDFNHLKSLCNMINTLKLVDNASTEHIGDIRTLSKQLDNTVSSVLCGDTELTSQDVAIFQNAVDEILASGGTEIDLNQNITTTGTIETFQLGGSLDDIDLQFAENSVVPPEHGTIVQKLWKVRFKDNTTGYAVVSDTSDTDLSTLLTAQLSTALADSPSGVLEDLDITISISDLTAAISSRDLSALFTGLEKPGLVARQLRDIDVDTDPITMGLPLESKNTLKAAILARNSATTPTEVETAQVALHAVATDHGCYSTSVGPEANPEYSDLKKIRLVKTTGADPIDVILSLPVVSWGSEPIAGIPLRDNGGATNKTNRKDDGTSYIVDLGGIDPVIRNGTPNPLPAFRFYNNGPAGATETEGALDRYKGGKCLGINTTSQVASFQGVHYETDGEITVTLEPLTALWMLDRASFDLGNSHAYYTVFSASRPPPAGFMGGVFAPKQNRLGRGRGEIASGVTLANGVSSTGNLFYNQDDNGAILDGNDDPVDSGLKGLTSSFDGHGLDPKDLLKFMQDNAFVKGTQYLTIPADATVETVEDVLIPAGQFVPQITQAIATLMQFGNGKFIQDGGPTRFQPGLIPFLPGTPAYTPEWHINFIYYNAGSVECEGNSYPITNAAVDDAPGSWIRPNHNASFGPPGPNPANSKESGFSPAHPDTFDPVQLRCGIKEAECVDFIDTLEGSKDGEISLSMLSALENDNKILFTEAPGGAMRGWVKFLVVNCPLPVMATINVTAQSSSGGGDGGSGGIGGGENDPNCSTCSCERPATTIAINGDLNPIWLNEDVNGDDAVIGTRILKLKVGDNMVIRSTTGTMHGVSLRMDNMTSNVTFDGSKTLEVAQDEVLTELEGKLTINNKSDLENNITALAGDIINFHGGVPITFTQKATINPASFPDGVVIADFTVKAGAEESSGSVACTVHGVSMSFRFDICP